MTEHQDFALKNPCERPEQCVDGRFFRSIWRRPVSFTAVLTVNVGEEGRALWMVSVAVQRLLCAPKPREEWTNDLERAARAVALSVLQGVGDPETDTEEHGPASLIIRRQCNDEERLQALERYVKGI